MCRKGLNVDEFCNPPQKVLKIYQAVTDLMAQKADINTIKVSDITECAGIGKGTAYEYFSSRDEIIIMALLYDYGTKLHELEQLLGEVSGFRGKILFIFDWLHDHKEYHATFVHMMRLSVGSVDIKESLKGKISPDIYNGMMEYLLKHMDKLLEQGYREQAFSEKDPVRRRMAFASALVQLALTFGEDRERKFFSMEFKEARNYAYDSLIRMLS